MNSEKKEKLISLSEAARISGYATEHLNLCVRKKKLAAEKLGRNWYTTVSALTEFVEGNDKKGDKREALSQYLAENQIEFVLTEEDREEILAEIKKPSEALTGKAAEAVLACPARDAFPAKRFFAQAVLLTLAVAFAVSAQSGKISLEKTFDFSRQDSFELLQKNEEGFLGDEAKALVLGEADEKDFLAEKIPAAYASENFQIKEIRFGGGANILALAPDLGPLEISGIKGEALRKGDEDSAKILVVFATNKPAKTKINFSKADGQGEKIFEEKFYDKSHAVVLSRADLSNTYHYQITARDKSGAEKKSETFAIYSGTKEMSIFDIIAGAVNDTFGWTANMR